MQCSWKTLGDGHKIRQTSVGFARAGALGPCVLSCLQRKYMASSYLNPEKTASHCSSVAALVSLVCEGLSVFEADTEGQKSEFYKAERYRRRRLDTLRTENCFLPYL